MLNLVDGFETFFRVKFLIELRKSSLKIVVYR